MSSPFFVHLKNRPDQTGIAIKTETQPVPTLDAKGNPTGGIQYQGIVHVLWDDPELASPAPSFHGPQDLVHMGLMNDPDDGEEEGEEEEETEESEESEDSSGDTDATST